MPIKKSELYSSLSSSCDELRGGMDARQYKDYVRVLLFIKYASDRHVRATFRRDTRCSRLPTCGGDGYNWWVARC